MSSQSLAPDPFGEDLEAANGCSGSAADNEWHRALLWQQVWEHLIHECRERAARRRANDYQPTGSDCTISTGGAAHPARHGAGDTGQGH
jgi:hypothetical protein